MAKQESNVDRIYNACRQMAANFEFKPDERINESSLATKLEASRTPVREALNRLVAEGFLTFQNGRGFFCRSLSPNRIMDLYEARVAIECEALRRCVERATDDEIALLVSYLDASEPHYQTCDDPMELLGMDEKFHMDLARLSQNSELVLMLNNLNDRIRYVRLVDLKSLRSSAPIVASEAAQLSAHRIILAAVERRDGDAAVAAMRSHIERRREEATDAVRIAYSQLYVPSD
ncbi:GntR family transcriptional regulator [Candidatus Halocynthiibacter alkanivorans]|jgi:DNA-binding GntR family transcriptional regulator|uniref:GntR family transcriptional regulator n=1 Tax=Candidatus Halocynthiibacter alkanivorans TaxID=2267619 RepID=UPI000DF2FD27|nr:GntR family transcriptional regulator [Candidatus Halocynthiibacter alkanivorans]